MFERARDGQIFNTALVIDPGGTVVKRYRKMFPFLPYEQGVAPGAEFCVVRCSGGRTVRPVDLLRYVDAGDDTDTVVHGHGSVASSRAHRYD